jgi:Zn-dependent protease
VSETPYDLRFRLLNIPVRVHPLFWLVSAILGWRDKDLPIVAAWIACVFFSVLVHEFGHGLTAMRFGSSPSILLYGMGGLCFSEADRQSRWQRLAVVLMGPGAGFLLCLLVMAVTTLLFGLTPAEHLNLAAGLIGFEPASELYMSALMKFHSGPGGEPAFQIYQMLVWINLMWGFVNLLPIWPLDGGRVCDIVLSYFNPTEGRRWTHIISLVLAGVLAVVQAQGSSFFLTIFFASFALMNFQLLQSIHDARKMGFYQDDDWWRQ